MQNARLWQVKHSEHIVVFKVMDGAETLYAAVNGVVGSKWRVSEMKIGDEAKEEKEGNDEMRGRPVAAQVSEAYPELFDGIDFRALLNLPDRRCVFYCGTARADRHSKLETRDGIRIFVYDPTTSLFYVVSSDFKRVQSRFEVPIWTNLKKRNASWFG